MLVLMVRSVAQRRVSNHEAKMPQLGGARAFILRDAAARLVRMRDSPLRNYSAAWRGRSSISCSSGSRRRFNAERCAAKRARSKLRAGYGGSESAGRTVANRSRAHATQVGLVTQDALLHAGVYRGPPGSTQPPKQGLGRIGRGIGQSFGLREGSSWRQSGPARNPIATRVGDDL